MSMNNSETVANGKVTPLGISPLLSSKLLATEDVSEPVVVLPIWLIYRYGSTDDRPTQRHGLHSYRGK
jgi:hypothetical protein